MSRFACLFQTDYLNRKISHCTNDNEIRHLVEQGTFGITLKLLDKY